MMTARRRRSVIVAISAGVALLVVASDVLFGILRDRGAGGVYPPLDDAYIHAQIARNLTSGQGFGLNPDTPTAASTSPLFTLLLATVGQFSSSVSGWIWSARVIGILAHAGTAVLLFWLVSSRFSSLLVASVGVIAVMLQGSLIWGATSGMEVALAAFLCLLVVAVHVRLPDGHFTAGVEGVLLGFLILTRPDTFPLLAVVIADRMVHFRMGTGVDGRASLEVRYSPSLVTVPVACGLIVLVYTGWAAWVGVSPVPNSFAVKVGYQGYAVTLDYWRDSLFLLFRSHPFLWCAWLVATVVGIRQWLKGSGSAALVACPWVLLFAQSIGNPHLHNHGRYLTILLPVIGLTVAEVFRHDGGWSAFPFEVRLGRGRWPANLPGAAVVNLFVLSLVLFSLYSTTTWSDRKSVV